MRHLLKRCVMAPLGAVPCAPDAFALRGELQSALSALRSHTGDPVANQNRAGREQRRLAGRVFLLQLRLHWATSRTTCGQD